MSEYETEFPFRAGHRVIVVAPCEAPPLIVGQVGTVEAAQADRLVLRIDRSVGTTTAILGAEARTCIDHLVEVPLGLKQVRTARDASRARREAASSAVANSTDPVWWQREADANTTVGARLDTIFMRAWQVLHDREIEER